MRTSDAGIEMIKGHEGLVLYAYPDPGTGGEPWTIGYGHTKGVLPGMSISEAQAEAFLREDLEGFERAVASLLPIPLTQSEFDALVSALLSTWAPTPWRPPPCASACWPVSLAAGSTRRSSLAGIRVAAVSWRALSSVVSERRTWLALAIFRRSQRTSDS